MNPLASLPYARQTFQRLANLFLRLLAPSGGGEREGERFLLDLLWV